MRLAGKPAGVSGTDWKLCEVGAPLGIPTVAGHQVPQEQTGENPLESGREVPSSRDLLSPLLTKVHTVPAARGEMFPGPSSNITER